MKFSTKIFTTSLGINALGMALYFIALRVIYLPFIDLITPAMIGIGLFAIVLFPTALVARARSLPVDKAAAEKAGSGFVSDAAIEAIDLSQHRLSWFPITIQNLAVFLAFAIGDSIFEMNPLIILRLSYWREFVFLLAPFLLASVGQSLFNNILFSRAREKLEIKCIRSPKRFGLANKIILTAVSLVLIPTAHILGIAQIGVSRIYLEEGISSTRIAYRDLPDEAAKLDAAHAMLDGMDAFVARVSEYNAETRTALDGGSLPEGYLDAFFTDVHLKNPLMRAIEGKSDDLVRQILIYIAINLPLTVLVLVLLSYQILQPFALIRAADARAGGKSIVTRLPVTAIDEVGELVNRFNGIIDKSRREILEISRIVGSLELSGAELSRAVEEVSSAAMDIDAATESTIDAENMQKGVVATAESDVASLAQAAERVTGAIRAQNGAIESLSAEIARISEGVEGVRAISRSSETAASRIAQAAEGGTASARACVKKMAEIELSSRDAADIVRVVSEIADKTKLLAMNASIEAAHAGASGKGFAVIANEIRSLANATSGQTTAVLQGIDSMVAGIAEAARLSEQADAAFRDVSREAGETSSLARETAATANEQADSTAGIRKASDALVEQAHSLTELAELLRSRSESLRGVSRDVVASSKGIEEATEANAAASRAVSEAVERLEAVAAANVTAINSLQALAAAARGT